MFRTIVWATDGSEHADSTLGLVAELARVHGSRIVAVHIDQRFHGGRLDGGPLLADEEDLVAKIEAQVKELDDNGFAARLELVTTDRHDTSALIAETAVSLGAGLIVIGTHGYGEFEAVVMGSVARGLTHDAHCPVLVVPPKAAPEADAISSGEDRPAHVGLGF